MQELIQTDPLPGLRYRVSFPFSGYPALQNNFLLQILSGLHHVVRPAQIAPIILIGPKGEDVFSLGSEPQIGSDDGENAFFNHHRKKTRRNDMDAAKSQRLHLLGRSNKFSFLTMSPAAKLKLLVEEQVSSRLPVLHRQCGESLILSVKLHHALEINRGDNVNIVQNKRLAKTPGIVEEKIGRLPQAAARVEQDVLARDFNVNAEVIVGFQIVENRIGKVMHIDNHLANPKGEQARERDLQQRAAGDFHQGLGAMVGEWPQARTEPGGQNHRFHLPKFSSSRCRTTTSTPFLPRKCFASSSARYTERCWPPVQPNDTIKLLKPRR